MAPVHHHDVHHYGVLRLAGRKQYARALGLLLHGLTAPTQVVNAITVATYKKYALVSLIHAGARPPPPPAGLPLHTFSTALSPSDSVSGSCGVFYTELLVH